MINRYTRTDMGGGIFAPSVDDRENWLVIRDAKLEELLELSAEQLAEEWDKTEPFTEREAMELANDYAYKVTGIPDDEF